VLGDQSRIADDTECIPAEAFVFSMSQANSDMAFRQLTFWIGQENVPGSDELLEDTLRVLATISQANKGPVLLAFDGLEKIQSLSGNEGVGRILDRRVRDLLIRVAYGALPGVCVLVTTRLSPIDVEIQRLPHFTKIKMDAMDPDAAVALLRLRGSRDSDQELKRLPASYGYHALTLDLLGSTTGMNTADDMLTWGANRHIRCTKCWRPHGSPEPRLIG
jgi:hypothetical protein